MQVGYLVENDLLGLGTVEEEINEAAMLVKWFGGGRGVISIHEMTSHYLENTDERGNKKYQSWYWRISGQNGKESEVRVVSKVGER
tara:strand:+ start:750 stop:1007 length:258 start_codon:yes stop_codon:yes gene_type:complete